ncbi:hypothetical protein [Streptomyces lydicus]|uniref:hypothetical protein n=1 Tax=Streptomyces lydicus TaxID=47763 RepID=UPI0039A4E2A4
MDAVLRALELPARALVPGRGLRPQVIRATGAGKPFVAVRSAEELHAGRVLVLVPSLNLLVQTEATWREGGRRGPRGGVSSLRGGGELRRTLVFHHVVKEAEAFAVGLPGPCRAAAQQGPGILPADRVGRLAVRRAQAAPPPPCAEQAGALSPRTMAPTTMPGR